MAAGAAALEYALGLFLHCYDEIHLFVKLIQGIYTYDVTDTQT